MDLQRRLTPAEINALPICQYAGPVYVIRGLFAWNKALPDLLHSDVLGFDTETRPSFRKGRSNAPALVQLSTDKAVYIIQLSSFPFNAHLAKILSDPHILKVGVAIQFDMLSLATLFPFEPAGMLDLGVVASLNKIPAHGLRTLTAQLFAQRLTKGQRCSNWNVSHLSQRQLVYAATDAWISRLLYLRMRELGFIFQQND